jgi:hypothetical protein
LEMVISMRFKRKSFFFEEFGLMLLLELLDIGEDPVSELLVVNENSILD